MADNDTSGLAKQLWSQASSSPPSDSATLANQLWSQRSNQPDPSAFSGNFADHYFSTGPVSKVMSAFGEGLQQGWGSKTGFPEAAEQAMRKVGVYNDYSKQQDSTLKAWNEAVMRPIFYGMDTAYRAGDAVFTGTVSGLSQYGEELQKVAKLGEETVDQQQQDHPILSGITYGLSGVAGMASDVIGETIGHPVDPSDPSSGYQSFLPEVAPHTAHDVPKIFDARSKGLIGEGEQAIYNTKPITPEEQAARDEFAKEAGVPPTKAPPPVTDPHELVKQIDPGLLNEYNEKLHYHDVLTERLKKLGEQEVSDFPDEPEDTRGQENFFHGTSKRIEQLSDYPGNSESNIYGAGLYTTDAIDVVRGYSKKGSGATPSIYQLNKTGKENLVDMDAPFTPEVKKVIEEQTKYNDIVGMAVDSKEEGGDGATTLKEVYDSIRGNSAGEGMPKYEVQELFDSISYELQKVGYTGLQHIGGKNTGTAPHTVQIHWTPESLGQTLTERPDLLKGPEPVRNRIPGLRPDTPELAQAKEAFIENYSRLKELEPQVQEAYNYAQDLIPKEEPGAKEAETVSEQPPTASRKPVQTETEVPDTQVAPTESARPEASERLSGGTDTGDTGTGGLLDIKGTGETAIRGLAQSLENEARASGMTEAFGKLPETQKLVMRDVWDKAAEVAVNDPERAERIAKLQEAPPDGTTAFAVVRALSKRALETGDFGAIQRIATAGKLPDIVGTAGQLLRSGVREEEFTDPLSIINRLTNLRQVKLEKRLGTQKLNTEAERIGKEIESTSTPFTPEDLQSFVKSIECDY